MTVRVVPDSKAWVATRSPLGTFPTSTPFGSVLLTAYFKPSGAPKSRKTMPRTARRLGIAEEGIEWWRSLSSEGFAR